METKVTKLIHCQKFGTTWQPRVRSKVINGDGIEKGNMWENTFFFEWNSFELSGHNCATRINFSGE